MKTMMQKTNLFDQVNCNEIELDLEDESNRTYLGKKFINEKKCNPQSFTKISMLQILSRNEFDFEMHNSYTKVKFSQFVSNFCMKFDTCQPMIASMEVKDSGIDMFGKYWE